MELYQTIHLELIGPVNLYLGMGIEIVMALILGAMVGFDREKKMKAAGLKTNILICIGATLYTSISILHIHSFMGTGNPDPNRVAAQIVSGIGFLGAGAIIQGRGSVIGLTTAATIWVVAAIGYTIGVGYPFTAALFSITVLIVLKLISPLYRFIEREKDISLYQLEVLSRGSVKRMVKDIVFDETYDIEEIYEEDYDANKNKILLIVVLNAHHRMIDRIALEIESSIKVEQVSYHKHIEERRKKSIARPEENS